VYLLTNSLKTSLEHRAKVRGAVRAFFADRDYLEVETPSLVFSPDIEPTLSHMVTEVRHRGAQDESMALITSPEYALKKLIAGGNRKVFELARVFRNDEPIDELHSHEFTMLEWYSLGSSFEDGVTETLSLLEFVYNSSDKVMPEVRLETVASLFKKHVGITELSNATVELYRTTLSNLNMSWDSSDTINDLFQRLFLGKIEPLLRMSDLITVVSHYPFHEATLAKINDDGFAERFEIYVSGTELCNAYGELTDSIEQRRRFEAELAERRRMGKQIFTIDEDLLSSLDQINEPLFGNALGFDRLVKLTDK
jgi:elongation factor P--(R)-beta-lysine ligase